MAKDKLSILSSIPSFNGLKVSQVASSLGWKENTLRVYLYREGSGSVKIREDIIRVDLPLFYELNPGVQNLPQAALPQSRYPDSLHNSPSKLISDCVREHNPGSPFCPDRFIHTHDQLLRRSSLTDIDVKRKVLHRGSIKGHKI